VKDDEWLCPFCEHIIDPSVLGDDLASAEGAPRAEITKIVAWAPGPENTGPHDDPPDAMILGEVGVAEKDFSVVPGAAAKEDGRTSTFLFYTSGATSRIVHPDAIVKLTERDATIPRTPYEDFILSLVDGTRSVRAIQRASGLAPQEVVITLLTLLDKGVISVETPSGFSTAPRRSPLPSEADTHDADSPLKEDAQPTEDRKDEVYVSEDATVDGFPAPTPPSLHGAVPEGDLEDLPSVRDFQEIETTDDEVFQEEGPTAELSDELGDLSKGPQKTVSTPPPAQRAPSPRVADLADDDVPTPGAVDRWASHSPVAEDADDLIEREERLPVAPSELDASDSEMVTDHGQALEAKKPAQRRGRSSQRRARFEDPSEAPREKSDKKKVERDLVTARDRTPPPAVVPTPKTVTPVPSTARAQTPMPPELDSSFLVEMPKSIVAKKPQIAADKTPPPSSIRTAPPLTIPDEDDEDSRPQISPLSPPSPDRAASKLPSRVVASAVKRAPIEERDRRKDESVVVKKDDRAKPAAPRGASNDVAPPIAPDKISLQPAAPRKYPPGAEGARMLKAQKLYEEALKEKAEGNLLSARMNMKLALTFDPSNDHFKTAFEELQKMGPVENASLTATKSRARELYDLATQKEEMGDVDEAIALLEKALHERKEPAFYNRLGVILATKKREFHRAQQLIETAIELSPGNATYQHNLGKVLSMAAARDVAVRNSAGPGKKGILSLLGRKK
jgi:hypothetical protein